jgi:hypothetical protein
MRQISRRRLLGSAVAAAGAIGCGAWAAEAGRKTGRAKVVVVTCPDVIDKDKPLNAPALRRMMDAGITALAGKRDVKEAWKSFIRPGDNVALADSGTWLNNVPEVVVETMRGITMASPKAVTLTYCALDEMKPEFLSQLRDGLKRQGISPGLMDGSVYTIKSNYHKRNYTSLVMTPTVKRHSIAGVGGVVKHYSTMSKDGPAPHHPNAMETAGSVIVPEFGHMSHLVIVDALRFGDLTKGPMFWQKSLIFGTDPVATDVIALEVYLRNCKPYENLPPERHRILADTRYHAGISDRARIDVTDIRV